jgi:hypothetical protein
MGSPETAQDVVDAFTEAKARWESIIVNDLGDFPKQGEGFDWFNGDFDSPYNEDVDDVVIGYAIDQIDGVGGTLGFAGTSYTRVSNGSPISGIMKFDEDDFASGRYTDEDIKLIILHEMGR